MKPRLDPVTTDAPPAATPPSFPEPTATFRKRAWTAFETTLDPLGTARPLRQADSRI